MKSCMSYNTLSSIGTWVERCGTKNMSVSSIICMCVSVCNFPHKLYIINQGVTQIIIHAGSTIRYLIWSCFLTILSERIVANYLSQYNQRAEFSISFPSMISLL